MGYSGVQANLMTVPVYAASYAILIMIAWASDFFLSRGIPIAIGGCTMASGYLGVAFCERNHARYGCTFLIGIVSQSLHLRLKEVTHQNL